MDGDAGDEEVAKLSREEEDGKEDGRGEGEGEAAEDGRESCW